MTQSVAMEFQPQSIAPVVTTASSVAPSPEYSNRSIFEVPPAFFDSCTIIPSPHSLTSATIQRSCDDSCAEILPASENYVKEYEVVGSRLTCNTCKSDFESLLDQRLHFKSDIHRFNVKLSISGKNIVKEDEFDEMTFDSFKDYDVSSISGSEDEMDKIIGPRNDVGKDSSESVRKKLFIRLQTGERVSVWKCLIMNESENISYEDKTSANSDNDFFPCLRANDVIRRLENLIHEPRDGTHLRIILLASGGHFAGCVFNGNMVVAHKTFHRYVVRAKAGKKQSSKDGTGRSFSSAGASLRRYNELALKKDVQDLLTSWKPYFDASSCIFIYAPSNNRQLLFSAEKPYFSHQNSVIRNVPLTVRRPTFKESRRVYEQLIRVSHEADEESVSRISNETITTISTNNFCDEVDMVVAQNLETEASLVCKETVKDNVSSESENEVISSSTPLHEAVASGNAHQVLELLEQGLDPCVKDEKGRTPYMLANDKEVRNTFRRFMASNPDKWDWISAKVPSALTKEMEDSQAAKQAEKDAKRKARAKELKKLRKAKEKLKAQAAVSQNSEAVNHSSVVKGEAQLISKEEKLKRAAAEEREKRAAAAEKRIAALNLGAGKTTSPGTSQPKNGVAGDIRCSCCDVSLAGIVPFHRYNFKYCSSSCMHVHKDILEQA